MGNNIQKPSVLRKNKYAYQEALMGRPCLKRDRQPSIVKVAGIKDFFFQIRKLGFSDIIPRMRQKVPEWKRGTSALDVEGL